MALIFAAFSAAEQCEAEPSFVPHHVYVADAGAGLVYRFKLRADGLPEVHADGMLHGDLLSPSYIAFNGAGDLYVSDARGTVDVYAPGAVGNAKPIRSLALRGDGAGPIALGNGHLFVLDTTTNAVEVFQAGARGEAKPLVVIQNWSEPVTDLAVDKNGTLYILAEFAYVYKYGDPLAHPDDPSDLVVLQGTVEDLLAYSFTLSSDDRLIYLAYNPRSLAPFGRIDFAVRANNRPAPAFYDPSILTHDCATDGLDGEPHGLALSGRYLVVSCLNGGIDVYDTTLLGRQDAIEAFGQRIFVSNLGLGIGP